MAEANRDSGTEASTAPRKRSKARAKGGSSKAVAKKSGGGASKAKKPAAKVTAKKVALGVGAVALTAAAGYAVSKLLKNRKAKKRTGGPAGTGN